MYDNRFNHKGDESSGDLTSCLMQLKVDRSLRLMDSSTSRKETLVASSSSLAFTSDINDDLTADTNVRERNEDTPQGVRKAVFEKVEFPQNLYNWTANDSLTERMSNVAEIKDDLDRLVKDESAKRGQHNHAKEDLQEAWDKLVQLRTHISLFKSAIVEATIEDVSLQAERGDYESTNLGSTGSRVSLSAESAIRLNDVRGIREKIRLKESLQMKVGTIEEKLFDLRTKLSYYSSELTRLNNSTDQQLISNSMTASMRMRQTLISNSQQLEDTEREYLATGEELHVVDMDLSLILERIRSCGGIQNIQADIQDEEKLDVTRNVAALNSCSMVKQQILKKTETEVEREREIERGTVNSENLSKFVIAVMNGEDVRKEIALTMRNIPENRSINSYNTDVRCEFSLHEVLSGHARVPRLNGEEPKAYRTRLEKRLNALFILDRQLQEELLLKAEDVRRTREQLRDVEVLRLRVELQVSNIESSQRQLLLDNPKEIIPSSKQFFGGHVPINSSISPILHIQVPSGDCEDDTPHRLNPSQSDFTKAQALTGSSAQKSKIPGSMYSPHVSPDRSDGTGNGRTRDFSPTDTPSVLSLQSQEYLYSVAQLVAHSGIKTPCQTVPQSSFRPRSKSVPSIRPGGISSVNGLSENQVDRLQTAAILLESDLASRPKGFAESPFYDDYRASENYDLRFSEKSHSNSVAPLMTTGNSKEYQYQSIRSQLSPRAPIVETYDSKSGRRLSLSSTSTSAPVSLMKGYLEQHLNSPRMPSERSKSVSRYLHRSGSDISPRAQSDRNRNKDKDKNRNKGKDRDNDKYKASEIEINTEQSESEESDHEYESIKEESNISELEGYSARYASQSQDLLPLQSLTNQNSGKGKENILTETSQITGKKNEKSSGCDGKIPKGGQRVLITGSQGVRSPREEKEIMRINTSCTYSEPAPTELSSNGIKDNNLKKIQPKFSPPTSPKEDNKLDKKYFNYVHQMRKSNGKLKEASPSAPSLTEQSLQKLAQCQAKLMEVMRTETMDENTGIAMDRNGKSLGFVDVEVVSARNLPEMKKLSHSADPYIELSLISDTSSNVTTEGSEVARTSVQWKNLFPVWRENLRLSPVKDLTQLIQITVKDATKCGDTVIIGICTLPLTKLLNQTSQNFWISLLPPIETSKYAMKKPKFHENCAVRVTARLSYCKRIFLQQKFDTMLEQLKSSSKKLNLSIEVPSSSTRKSFNTTPVDSYSKKGVVGARSPMNTAQSQSPRDSPKGSPRDVEGGRSSSIQKGGGMRKSSDVSGHARGIGTDHRRASPINGPHTDSPRSSRSRSRSRSDLSPQPITQPDCTKGGNQTQRQSILLQQRHPQSSAKSRQRTFSSSTLGFGVYDMMKNDQSPSSQPKKKILRIIGLRERQGGVKVSASDLCSRSNSNDGYSSTQNEEKLSRRIQALSPSPILRKDKTVKKEPTKITNSPSDMYGTSSQPDLTIFKSSRSRFASQEKVNKQKIKFRADIALITSPRLP